MQAPFPIIATLVLITCISISAYAMQETARRSIQGTVEVEKDCPVALSDARMEAVENQPPPHRSVILQHQVSITNNSARDIKRISLAFIQESETGGIITSLRVEDAIKAGEVRTSIQKITIKLLARNVSETLKVRVTGISFRDGTRWVPPRSNDYLLLWQTLFHRNAPLRVMGCNDLENDHRLKLQVGSDNVVAYRLGVLKDTPDNFAVKLGEWINLVAPNAVKGKETEIIASANQTGLKPEDIYKLEYFTRYSRTGRAITNAHGVAFFVAEVKFVDGTVWQQDLRREFLIWDE